MSTIKSFIKEFVAIINGDNAEVTAQKVYRKADAAFKSHIASLESETIDLEQKVEDAKEALKLARFNNGKLIEDNRNYIQVLVNAKNALSDAEEALLEHNETINFLKEEHRTLNS